MYELIQVTDTSYYVRSPAKIGLYRASQDEVYLIDSGNNRDAGKRAKRLLDSNGWTLKAILNTHSHADHVGGNQYLQSQTGCRIYATDIERVFTEHPVLGPAFLYGGFPYPELRHKFLMAESSEVLPLEDSCLPEGMERIPLPGHTWDMTGFRTGDGIVFLADCLSSEATLEKYGISFLIDVQTYLDTLQKVRDMEATLFIPSHADPTENIAPLARLNMDKVYEIADTILGICREPADFGTVLQKLFERYQLNMTFEQHALVGSTVRSYLAWLNAQGRLQAEIDRNRLVWRA